MLKKHILINSIKSGLGTNHTWKKGISSTRGQSNPVSVSAEKTQIDQENKLSLKNQHETTLK
jgi:hypothetical protein